MYAVPYLKLVKHRFAGDKTSEISLLAAFDKFGVLIIIEDKHLVGARVHNLITVVGLSQALHGKLLIESLGSLGLYRRIIYLIEIDLVVHGGAHLKHALVIGRNRYGKALFVICTSAQAD